MGLFEQIRGKKILVIGDVILDRWVYGQIKRLSPESNCPVIETEKEVIGLGGAANVAANIKSLSGEPFLVGYVGKDEEASILNLLLHTESIESKLLTQKRPTITKSRIYSLKNGNPIPICRVDREQTDSIKWTGVNVPEVADFDAVVFSDYDKGTINKWICQYVIAKANEAKIPVIADPKYQNWEHYKGVTAITPNQRELQKNNDTAETFDCNAMDTFRFLGCEYILLTQGKHGMILYEYLTKKSDYASHDGIKDIKISPRQIVATDVTGAGDTVTAAFSLCLSANIDPIESAQFANHAASIAVSHERCYAPKPGDFE